MLERFTGKDGGRRLLDALLRQETVAGSHDLAEAIGQVCDLEEFPPGGILASQGAGDSEVYFILSGRVAIEVNGLEVAIREAGTHVGEMAALDLSAPRSATVRALEPTVVARASESAIGLLAEQYPQLWRNLAVSLGYRLRQRSRFIRVPNDRPQLFIGSSVEMLPVARGIQAGLSYDDVSVAVWTDGVFRASRDGVSNLLDAAGRSDFGILVLGPDDVVISRGNELSAPRDNVIFEIGLFMGAVGRDRTFIVKQRGAELRLPSDLLGIIPIEYAPGEPTEGLAARLGPVCSAIRTLVAEHGVK